MSHFYKLNEDKKGYLTEASTPSQAKKIGALPSVTTIMGVQKDAFLDGIWSPRRFIDLARVDPRMSEGEIFRQKFGMRNHPEGGDLITASEFGTSVHDCLEGNFRAKLDRVPAPEPTCWTPWAEPFLIFVEENDIMPVEVEYVAISEEFRAAGTIDFIGQHADGKYVMYDYKCRDTKGRGGKFYEKKDCTQLAIESYMISEMWGLDYLPKVYSVCIDITTTKHYHKEWDDVQMSKGIERFFHQSSLYWMDEMKEK